MMARLTRLPDWRSRLLAYLSGAAALPYVEGKHDCALNCANAVLAMTGVDYAEAYRGRYTSQRGGYRILRKDGFRDHVDLVAHHLTEKPVSFAHPGDVAVVDGPFGASLGVVQGELIYVLNEEGLATVPLLSASRCFEV